MDVCQYPKAKTFVPVIASLLGAAFVDQGHRLRKVERFQLHI
jgi:hypothetical protein